MGKFGYNMDRKGNPMQNITMALAGQFLEVIDSDKDSLNRSDFLRKVALEFVEEEKKLALIISHDFDDMRIITCNFPCKLLHDIDHLVKMRLYPSRSECFRVAIRDYYIKRMHDQYISMMLNEWKEKREATLQDRSPSTKPNETRHIDLPDKHGKVDIEWIKEKIELGEI